MDEEKPIFRFLIGFVVIAVCIFQLAPLLRTEFHYTWPFGLSDRVFSVFATILTAIVIKIGFDVRYGKAENRSFALVFVPIVLIFAGIAWGLTVIGVYTWLAVCLFLMATATLVHQLFSDLEENKTSHVRGRQLIPFDAARKKVSRIRSEEDRGVFWGFLRLPSNVATSHFCVTGSTGSGKTISLRLLMQSVLPEIQEGSDNRALIYDAKQDMLSILRAICPGQRIVLLNPFDERGAAWDMAADIDTPATAQQVASILIPEEKKASQPFFADAARHLLTGVIVSFIKNSPGKWDFRDLIFTMKSADRLKLVLQRDESTRDLLEYFENELTAQNIMSTVATKLQRYEFIAAAWSHASEKISLRDWTKEEYILVLGNDEATRTALDAVNQVIFRRLSELVLDQSESETRRTWIFLDEVREMGHLEGLSRLLTKGRSKGTSVVIGFQDIEGLRDVYGNKIAAEITGQCSHKAILRTDSPETARWASSLFGERELNEINTSNSSSRQEGVGGKKVVSESSQSRITKRETVLPSEFMEVPPANEENGLGGYYLTPCVGSYFVRAAGEWVKDVLILPDENTENLIKRDGATQYLRAWSSEDLERLSLGGLRIEKEVTSKEQELSPAAGLGILEGVKREI